MINNLQFETTKRLYVDFDREDFEAPRTVCGNIRDDFDAPMAGCKNIREAYTHTNRNNDDTDRLILRL